MWVPLLALLLITTLLIAAIIGLRWLSLRAKALERFDTFSRSDRSSRISESRFGGFSVEERRGLGHWLYVAGYRRPTAAVWFLSLTAAGILIGLGIAIGFIVSGLKTSMEQAVVLVPGGVGETFLPVVWIAPWLLFLMISLTPWLIVRSERRKRIELIEQDLPLALELLSTLSEAGLGFDAGLTRILKTRLSGRPLAVDLQMFQADLLAGRARIEALRRLSNRIDLPSIATFVSAMVQAEQLGMGIARVLRQQADDVRARRRERAIAFANALPVKRVVPLVVCFLPGLFVWTLGPAFVQLFKMAETFIQVRSF